MTNLTWQRAWLLGALRTIIYCDANARSLSLTFVLVHSRPSLTCKRRLPTLEKLEPFGLVEPHQPFIIDRDRLHRAAELLGKGDARILAGDVGTHRIELGLLRGDRLPALGQQVIEPESAGVRILRVLGHE